MGGKMYEVFALPKCGHLPGEFFGGLGCGFADGGVDLFEDWLDFFVLLFDVFVNW